MNNSQAALIAAASSFTNPTNAENIAQRATKLKDWLDGQDIMQRTKGEGKESPGEGKKSGWESK